MAKEATNTCYDTAITNLYGTPSGFVQVALLNANRESMIIVGDETFSL